MAALRKLLNIKSKEEAREEVQHEPHVEEARKQLDRFYDGVVAAEQSMTSQGSGGRRRRPR
jgi:hypothetical protein